MSGHKKQPGCGEKTMRLTKESVRASLYGLLAVALVVAAPFTLSAGTFPYVVFGVAACWLAIILSTK